jgi:hypothetical protein
MKRLDDANPENWEKDPVWNLLRQAPRVEARPSFADDVVRAARLEQPEEPWWRRLRVPLALGSLGTAATAVVVALVMLNNPPADSQAPSAPLAGSDAAVPAIPAAESLESLDEMVRTEALLVAAEQPGDFSDAELVSLISY